MNVLVTGAGGLLGTHLVERLVERGLRVRTFDRHGARATSRGTPEVEAHGGDIRDPAAVARALPGCRVVYHLAALTHSAGRSTRETREVNEDGAARLALAAARGGVRRFVFCSTAGVYGLLRSTPAVETDAHRPNTQYRLSKSRAEHRLRGIAREHAMELVIARPAAVAGSRGDNWLPLCRAIATGGFRPIGSGTVRMPITSAVEVAEGIAACGTTPGIDGEAFNLTAAATPVRALLQGIADRLHTTLARPSPAFPFFFYVHLAERVFRLVRRELPRAPTYEMFVNDRHLSSERAAQRLDWQAQQPLGTLLDELIRGYRERGLLIATTR